MARDWAAYYGKTIARPPRETLVGALNRFAAEPASGPRMAVDLGCGNGRDTVELLRRGWRVLAMDAEPTAIDALLARDDLPTSGRLTTKVSRFEDADWPQADLFNAGFSLPLCPPEDFPAVWRNIVAALTTGGRFAGQLFGDRDSFAGDPGVSTHTKAAAEGLLSALDVESFREEEEDGVTPRGQQKHWHIFHIVARRR